MKPQMKFLPVYAAVICALLATSCTTTQVTQTLGPPEQVQSDITYLGGRAKQYVSEENRAKLHNFAVQLGQVSNGDISSVLALLPNPSGTTEKLLVATVKTTLQLVVAIYAGHNQTLLSYFRAVSTGLLANY